MRLTDRLRKFFGGGPAEEPLLETQITQRIVRKARKQGRKPLSLRHKRKIVRESRRANRS